MALKYITIGGLGTFEYDDVDYPSAVDTNGGVKTVTLTPAEVVAAIEAYGAKIIADIDTVDGLHGTEFFLKVGGKIGDATNYAEFASDGTLQFFGSATVYDDLQGSALNLKQKGPGLSTNDAEGTVEFTTSANLSDYLYDNSQMKHKWLLGSVVNPHVHWVQTENNRPNFLFAYRWQKQGEATTTAWTNHVFNADAFTYVSGSLNQISHGATITPPTGYGLSDIFQYRLLRDTGNASGLFSGSDPYSTTVGVTSVDTHIQEDSIGSSSEFTK